MYLYSYPCTHGIPGLAGAGGLAQLEVCLDMAIEWTQRYSPRSWSSQCGDALGGCDRASLEMHLEAVFKRVCRCTWRPWSCELSCCNRAGLEIRLEAVIEWVLEICTWWPWSCELRGCDWASLQIRLEAVIERVWRNTWRPWWSEFGDELGGRNRASLDGYWEAVDGRRAGCWDCQHQLVNSQPWECDKVTVPVSSHGELADSGWLCREACQMLKLHSGVNSQSWEWREDQQTWVDVVFGICCTRCQLMIIIWRYRESWLNFVFCDDSRVVDEKETDGRWRWEQYGGLQVDMRNQGYDLPDLVGITSYPGNNTTDQDLYLLSQGW